MKLIFCPECFDVVKLRAEEKRTCYCGESWGQYYPDHIRASYGGKCIPLGINNNSVDMALRGSLTTIEGWFYHNTNRDNKNWIKEI